MTQEIKKLSLKIDDRSLTDGIYHSEHGRQSTQPSPQPSPLQQPPPQQPPLHQQLPQQPPPSRRLLRNFQYEDLSDEEELNNPFYQEDDFKDETYDGGMAYGRGHRRIANHNPNRRRGFSFTNHDRRRDYPSPNEYMMKAEISSFNENLDIESFLN